MEKYKFIKKKFLDVNRIREIKQLQEFCFHHEKINMKLELEYIQDWPSWKTGSSASS